MLVKCWLYNRFIFNDTETIPLHNPISSGQSNGSVLKVIFFMQNCRYENSSSNNVSYCLMVCLCLFPTACALRRHCRWPSMPVSWPKTVMWLNGPNGQLAPRSAMTPTGPRVNALIPEMWASLQSVEEEIAQSWRRRSPAAPRETECHPALCKYRTGIGRGIQLNYKSCCFAKSWFNVNFLFKMSDLWIKVLTNINAVLARSIKIGHSGLGCAKFILHFHKDIQKCQSC